MLRLELCVFLAETHTCHIDVRKSGNKECAGSAMQCTTCLHINCFTEGMAIQGNERLTLGGYKLIVLYQDNNLDYE